MIDTDRFISLYRFWSSCLVHYAVLSSCLILLKALWTVLLLKLISHSLFLRCLESSWLLAVQTWSLTTGDVVDICHRATANVDVADDCHRHGRGSLLDPQGRQGQQNCLVGKIGILAHTTLSCRFQCCSQCFWADVKWPLGNVRESSRGWNEQSRVL